MRAVICWVAIVGLVLPGVALCADLGTVVCRGGDGQGAGPVAMPGDSGYVGGGGAEDTSGVVEMSEDHWWGQVVRAFVRICRNGVIWDGTKWVLRKVTDSMSAPKIGQHGAWQDEPPCGGVGMK